MSHASDGVQAQQKVRTVDCGRVSTGMSGSLRTACEGKSSAESGIPVPTVGINSDAETGSAVLTKRAASSPERSRAG